MYLCNPRLTRRTQTCPEGRTRASCNRDLRIRGQIAPLDSLSDSLEGRNPPLPLPTSGSLFLNAPGSIPVSAIGDELAVIESDDISGRANTYKTVVGSGQEVRAKAAAADAFLSQPNWQAGVWEIRDGVNEVDLTIRPDGHYSATNATQLLRGMVHGRYTLELRRVHFFPFVGQDIYSRDNGDFGKVDRTREIDYDDGELLLIDLEAISQSISVAHLRPGSHECVMEKTLKAQVRRAQKNWQVGIWVANDPNGWMRNSLTIFGGLGAPSTYTVNLGTVDASIAASLAADVAKAQVNAQWLARVPIGPRDPADVQIPTRPFPPIPIRCMSAPNLSNRTSFTSLPTMRSSLKRIRATGPP